MGLSGFSPWLSMLVGERDQFRGRGGEPSSVAVGFHAKTVLDLLKVSPEKVSLFTFWHCGIAMSA